jgi:hypothetical protein
MRHGRPRPSSERRHGFGTIRCAGAIETPIKTALSHDPAKLRSLLKQIPLGRPGYVAGVAAFLASQDAAYVTGSTFVADGGLSLFYGEQKRRWGRRQMGSAA